MMKFWGATSISIMHQMLMNFACENMRRLRLIHQFDGLRADRCAGAHGLDLIVPFLDKNFIDFCMTMNQNEKIGDIEKRILT